MSRGVALTELHCPTCGRPYPQPLEVHHPPEPYDLTAFGRPTSIVGRREPPYLECRDGHKWTVKYTYHHEPRAPVHAVLLGDYIGGSW